MADDPKMNPWPAIRELQDITREQTGELRDLELICTKLKQRIEVLEDFVQKLEGK